VRSRSRLPHTRGQDRWTVRRQISPARAPGFRQATTQGFHRRPSRPQALWAVEQRSDGAAAQIDQYILAGEVITAEGRQILLPGMQSVRVSGIRWRIALHHT